MSWKDTEDQDVLELNAKHFVAQEGGKTRVYNEKYDEVLEREFVTNSSFDDFRNLYCNRFVEIETRGPKGRPTVKFESLGAYWINHTDRRQYNEIVFDPSSQHEKEGVKNLWRGFSIEEKEDGCWELYKEHLLNIVCSGNEEYYNYYLDWMANVVQFPGKQGNVAIVLKGNRGTGKGTTVNFFADLFGQHFVHVVSSKQVTGNFNLHLRDAVLLFSDEAVYAGNHAEESVLKGIITEKYLAIEGKGRDLIMAKNHLHVIMATNNTWAVPAGLDERRFFVLNVKDDPAVKQNSTYFNAMRVQMEDGGRQRMLYDLKRRDISSYDCYKVPNTIGLFEQKLESLDAIRAWWFAKLNEGSMFDGFDWEDPLPSEAVYNDYINYCRQTGSRYNSNQIQLGKFINDMNPEGWPKSSRRKCDDYWTDNRLLTTVKKDKKHYIMAKLTECRKIFADGVKFEVVWPEAVVGVAPEKKKNASLSEIEEI